MSRHFTKVIALLVATSMLMTGCAPTQPFYFNEDGDMSHYMDAATDIEYPDVQNTSISEVRNAPKPRTLTDPDYEEIWNLSLEETVNIALKNSKIIRKFGQLRPFNAGVPENLVNIQTVLNPDVASIYGPALTESNPGIIGGSSPYVNNANASGDSTAIGLGQPGVEAALSDFDARLSTELFWSNADRPQNIDPALSAIGFGPGVLQEDNIGFQSQLTKKSADGTQFFLRNITNYSDSNRTSRFLPSDWYTAFEVEARRSLMRGGGTAVNRSGVILARIRTDMSLGKFEGDVRDMVREVENTYWNLYFAYRNLEAKKVGRDSALITWKKIDALKKAGAPGGEAEKEAQARGQYFLFRNDVEVALKDLFQAESNLRYLMGLAATDNRLIRPGDKPSHAPLKFDWNDVHAESLVRSVELRTQKWRIKQRETELIVARNGLLPRLDLVGMYRVLGMGDDLASSERRGLNYPAVGSTAYDELTEGKYGEFNLGFQFEAPIGYRQELAGVRHIQLLMARDCARLEDMELELSHQMSGAVRDLDAQYVLTQTNFNRRAAAEKEVIAVQAAYDTGTVTLDLLLEAQRRLADSEIAYYRSLVDYNIAIMNVHYRKGSLLEYNGVYLAEGPWPAKAYFDAQGRARQRDASYYLDYGYTRPGVVSQGPYQQQGGGNWGPQGTGVMEVIETPQGSQSLQPTPADPSGVPMPPPEPSARLSPAGAVPAYATSPVIRHVPASSQPAGVQPAKPASYHSSGVNHSNPSAPALAAMDLNAPVAAPLPMAPVPMNNPVQPVSYQE